MALKKVTIVLLPDGLKTVRQYKIPKIFICFFFLFSLSALAFITWTFIDYYNIKNQLPDRMLLLQENRRQELQLASLAGKIDQLNSKMVELKEFDNKLKVMVNLEPGNESTQFLGIGGSDPTLMESDYSIEKAHQKLVRLMHQSIDDLDTEISVQTQEKAELYEFLENQKTMFACTPSIWPAKGWVSSPWGSRTSPFTNEKEFHNGLDISARIGSPIIAPADGVVSSITKTDGFGNLLTVNHGYGFVTRYGHLSEILVKKGQSVKRGEKIALVGDSGRTTGSHLHYEVHVKGIPVNPKRYILN